MTIELKNVRFAYPESPDKTVLNITDWSVAAQEKVFVHGPSGCGKSTLLNLLSGILQSTKGEVSVLGEHLNSMSNRQRDRFRGNHIGYIFQQFNLIPYLNAIDNIKLASQFAHRQSATDIDTDISALLTTFNLEQSQWTEPVSRLSIGQQQRIAIARAMINHPEVLIADEPTSSLDEKNRDTFMRELMTMVDTQQTTLIFVSHDMSLASYFERIDALADINLAGGAH